MTIVTKVLISLLAVCGLAFGTAATASADDGTFVDAIASLNHYAITCAGCDRDAINVGDKVCTAFVNGKQAAIQAVQDSYDGPGQTNEEYYATLFAQFAAHDLCPKYDGQIGPV